MPVTIVRNMSGNTVCYSISTEDEGVVTLPARSEWEKIDSKKSIQPEVETGWRLITFKNATDTKRGGVYVNLAEPKLVEFRDFDEILVI